MTTWSYNRIHWHVLYFSAERSRAKLDQVADKDPRYTHLTQMCCEG